MSIDSTLVVAVVTVGGTLGATALTQFAGIRNKRLDAEIQYKTRLEERGAAASADKLAIYVQLNNAARDYKAFGHDYLMNKLDGIQTENLDHIEELRSKYREVYGRAQLILPDRVFKLAIEVNDCLSHSYRALQDFVTDSDRSLTGETLHDWYDRPLTVALRVLRRMLREDLGVGETRTDVDLATQRLREARLALWPDENSDQTSFPEDAL